MIKLVIALVSLVAAGCVIQSAVPPLPKPAPAPVIYCKPNQIENCRQWTAGERVGAGARGHSEDVEQAP